MDKATASIVDSIVKEFLEKTDDEICPPTQPQPTPEGDDGDIKQAAVGDNKEDSNSQINQEEQISKDRHDEHNSRKEEGKHKEHKHHKEHKKHKKHKKEKKKSKEKEHSDHEKESDVKHEKLDISEKECDKTPLLEISDKAIPKDSKVEDNNQEESKEKRKEKKHKKHKHKDRDRETRKESSRTEIVDCDILRVEETEDGEIVTVVDSEDIHYSEDRHKQREDHHHHHHHHRSSKDHKHSSERKHHDSEERSRKSRKDDDERSSKRHHESYGSKKSCHPPATAPEECSIVYVEDANSNHSNSGNDSWMLLPKDLEKNASVNASSWMRLPKDLEEKESPFSEPDLDDLPENESKSKKSIRDETLGTGIKVPKLDIKFDMSKALVTKPPPSTQSASLISSIQQSVLNDLKTLKKASLIESFVSVTLDKNAEATSAQPTSQSLTSSDKTQTSNDTIPSETLEANTSTEGTEFKPADVSKDQSLDSANQVKTEPAALEPQKEASSGPKKLALKFGIKISQTSAALIASGEKVENDPKKKNREEGEVTDSQEEDNADDPPDSSSSTSSDIRISELSSSGSISDSDEPQNNSDSKHHGHKKKKKEKKKKKKKHKDNKRRERSHSRSRSPKKRRHSRSRASKLGGFDEEKGVWRSRSRSRSSSRQGSHRRSRSRDRHHRSHDYRLRSRSRDRYRSSKRRRSRSPWSPEPRRKKTAADDLRLKIDKAKLRQIAFRNVQSGLIFDQHKQLDLKPDDVARLKAGGKSVEELTDFCKKIADKVGHGSGSDDSDDSSKLYPQSDEDGPFINHPFKVKDLPSNIVMNIRNARQLPILTPAEKQVQGAELRLQFPVSSGSHHRAKEGVWVPVEKPTTTVATTKPTPAPVATTIATTPAPTPAPTTILALPAPVTPATAKPVKPEDKVFPDLPAAPINIGEVVSERLSAMRKLQDNPLDMQAMGTMYKAQDQMNKWAESKNLPGHFTGSTGATIMSQSELKGIHQVWAKKNQLKEASPVCQGIGKLLLQRMGWKEGEGLGREGEGKREPLMLDVKIDRKGLSSMGEAPQKSHPGPVNAKDLSGKHPVSALVELCNRRKWGVPQFHMVHESGPDHKKNFLYKVMVNGTEYQSTIASTNKKHAKAQAATVCLQAHGLVPQ